MWPVYEFMNLSTQSLMKRFFASENRLQSDLFLLLYSSRLVLDSFSLLSVEAREEGNRDINEKNDCRDPNKP